MVNEDFKNILINLDSNMGRKTKVRILRLLKKQKAGPMTIGRRLGMKSCSHINKFLNYLYEKCLVDYEEDNYNNEYFKYSRKLWFTTELGLEFIDFMKNVSLTDELPPMMKLELLKRKIRSSDQYVQWKEEVFKKDNYTCQECQSKSVLQAHHITPFSEIISKNNLETLEDAIKDKELFDIENGLTLCSTCHIEKHSK